MGLLNKRKSDSGKKYDGHSKGDQSKGKTNSNRKETLYVSLSSHKAIFLVTGKPKESKYSYGIPIVPLHGYYYSAKHKRTFTAKELSDYYVVLNIPKDSVSEDELFEMSDAKIVITGYYSFEIYLEEPDDEEEEYEEEREEKSEEKSNEKKR